MGFLINVLLFGGAVVVSAALRPRPGILSHRRGGCQTARTPLELCPAASALHPQTIPAPARSVLPAGNSRRVPVGPQSHRPAVTGPHLVPRAGAVTGLGQAPLEEGSAGERFPGTEKCERPLNPSNAPPHTGWCQLSMRREDSQLLPPWFASRRETERDDFPTGKGEKIRERGFGV